MVNNIPRRVLEEVLYTILRLNSTENTSEVKRIGIIKVSTVHTLKSRGAQY